MIQVTLKIRVSSEERRSVVFERRTVIPDILHRGDKIEIGGRRFNIREIEYSVTLNVITVELDPLDELPTDLFLLTCVGMKNNNFVGKEGAW